MSSYDAVSVGKLITGTKTLGVFVPVYNEQQNLTQVMDDLEYLRDELSKLGVTLNILIHDNASTDDSWLIISNRLNAFSNSKAIRFQVNIGYQPSLTLSFTNMQSDAYVVYQSDRQDSVIYIIEMCKRWLSGAKTVIAIPVNRAETLADKLGRLTFIFLFKSTSDIEKFRWFTDFYLLDKSLYKQLEGLPLMNQFIRGRIMETFPIDSILEYNRGSRSLGQSKFGFVKKYALALDAILLHASRLIRRVTFFGALLSFLSIVAMIANTVINLELYRGSNFFLFAADSFVILILSFLLLLLSIALEYLRRIYGILLSTRNSNQNTHMGLFVEVIEQC